VKIRVSHTYQSPSYNPQVLLQTPVKLSLGNYHAITFSDGSEEVSN